ncbi:AEC family transporter [Oscillatoria sp. CS-180]|uniref:AEC family transporter n=1 Tax=Oscillatoria sp. CS-180 TaxID=3021720 RepID=UPI00232F8C60|nr:AEC family transporter [Oscillatoria sp. CS-180]MDB9524948.1 AEC family transporter [Oscillatoria sp. CS-180]
MAVLLPAIVPVAFIVFIGFITGRTLSLDRLTLSRLSLYVLMPALIASSLYGITLSASNAAKIVVGFFLSSAVLYGVVYSLCRLFKTDPLLQKTLIATAIFANTGNMGLPFITFALGESGLERAIVYLVSSSIFLTAVGPTLLKAEGIQSGLQTTLRLPVFWAMLAGLILQILAITLPLRLGDGLDLLGSAAIPVALVTLGMQLAKTHFYLDRIVILSAGLRLLLAPAIALIIGIAIGLQGQNLQVLVLQGAMPTAVNTFIWVTEFGGDADLAARAIVLSTILSALTLPTLLWLLLLFN